MLSRIQLLLKEFRSWQLLAFFHSDNPEWWLSSILETPRVLADRAQSRNLWFVWETISTFPYFCNDLGRRVSELKRLYKLSLQLSKLSNWERSVYPCPWP
mmetsp:Transcript_50224/g.104824  ORF Transcript_50224/g.104824 Transcript_50224/m.104824 type:complete len:100 (-) Transcript_50224:56-355(-)